MVKTWKSIDLFLEKVILSTLLIKYNDAAKE